MHIANDAIGVAGVLGRRIDLDWIGNVDQVMRDRAPLVGRHLVRADVEAAIDGGGIAVENLAAEPLRQCQTQRALAGRGRPEHGQDERLRNQSTRMNTYTTTTASTMMSPNCCVRVGMATAKTQCSRQNAQCSRQRSNAPESPLPLSIVH